ncbi:MAG: HEAT repeat domain-containing protein [Bacteroidota bacterium]
MSFYELSKEERIQLVEKISKEIHDGLISGKLQKTLSYFSDEDTYIRKSAYLSLGRIYFSNKDFQNKIIQLLETLIKNDDFKIRQTTINAAGEIGKKDFEKVKHFFDKGLFDHHHSVRNAVIGSVKKMSEVNPKPILKWASAYLHHDDKEIRREICHGIELRGRTHPQDILPLLRELQYDKTARVSKTLVHVLGQIAYKKGCLETVITDLKTWDNKQLVQEAIDEIIDVHNRYKDFAVKTQEEAIQYIEQNLAF